MDDSEFKKLTKIDKLFVDLPDRTKCDLFTAIVLHKRPWQWRTQSGRWQEGWRGIPSLTLFIRLTPPLTQKQLADQRREQQ